MDQNYEEPTFNRRSPPTKVAQVDDGLPRDVVEAGTPEGHMVRIHGDGYRELIRMGVDGKAFVVRPL